MDSITVESWKGRWENAVGLFTALLTSSTRARTYSCPYGLQKKGKLNIGGLY